MNFINITLTSLLCILNTTLFAQLYQPLEIKNAIKNQSRTEKGIPGPLYWQNTSNYNINATVDILTGSITGIASIELINRSPDTLKTAYIKLYQNLYQKGSARTESIKKVNVHEGVEIVSIQQNNQLLYSSDRFPQGTCWKLSLTEKIYPEEKTNFTIEFICKLPNPIEIRTGARDNNTYFAGYWFPQLAVYDDIFGWDIEEYMGHSEAYNNFSTYDVKLTLPMGYLVWATGNHTNQEEIFRPDIIKRITASKIDSTPIQIVSQTDINEKNIQLKKKYHTWHFEATNVPDFAFAFSNQYVWDAVAAKNPHSDTLCWVNAVYPPNKTNLTKLVGIAKESIEFFSQQFPGMPYPYAKHTTFLGSNGGGMEFPMIANNSEIAGIEALNLITSHEIAHNYFPFNMGINERKFGWFDEMMASQMDVAFLDHKYLTEKLPKGYSEENFYTYYGGKYSDLPIQTETSTVLKKETTLLNFYAKPLFALESLISIIGKEQYNSYLKDFMKIWGGKHPTGYDFFYFMNSSSGKDLNWFWDKWFFRFGYIDLAMQLNQVQKSVVIENIGGLPVPFYLNYVNNNQDTLKKYYSAEVWKETNTLILEIPKPDSLEYLQISLEPLPDLDLNNNTIQMKKNEIQD